MTYCLAIRADDGIVFVADSRASADVDYVTSDRKLHVFQPADDRVFVLLTAGSLATARELIDQIGRDLDEAPNGESLPSVRSLFAAAEYVGRLSRQIQEKHGPALDRIGASDETSYLQIGETKYGKPILDRLVRSPLSLGEAARLAPFPASSAGEVWTGHGESSQSSG